MAQKQPLWTDRELAKATGGRWLMKPPRDWSPVKVSYDTSSGKLPNHICIMVTPISWGRGRKEALPRLTKLAANGAACAIIQREQEKRLPKVPRTFPILVVKNTRHALRDLAKASRKRFEGKVLAVTGTVGKTTTREMLQHVLDRQGGASATTWNNNNIAGVQRTLAYTPRDNGYCVVEMGFGNPIDGIKTSSVAARPHVAILTTVSKAHIDAFPPAMLEKHDGVQLISDHKSLIFDGLEKGGVAVIGRANPAYERAVEHAKKHADRVVVFGDDEACDARIVALELTGTGSSVKAEIDGEPVEYQLEIPGKHMAVNALGVLVGAWGAGADLQQAAHDIGEFEAVTGRAKVFEIPIADGGTGRLIDDSFNATIASVRSSFEVLKLMTPDGEGRRVAVLGDIMHIGPDELEQHAALAEAVVENGVDVVFTNGPMMKRLWDALPEERRGTHTTTMADLYRDLRRDLRDGDIVAIKSGRGSGGLGDRAFLRLGDCLRKGTASWPF
jgi:UDP-N-acetylmuramoyl-tripeptide--D-alanyl-D-alanine ligase